MTLQRPLHQVFRSAACDASWAEDCLRRRVHATVQGQGWTSRYGDFFAGSRPIVAAPTGDLTQLAGG